MRWLRFGAVFRTVDALAGQNQADPAGPTRPARWLRVGQVFPTVEALRPSTKDEADLTNKAMAAIRLLLEDLKELPADNEIFRLQNIWPREQWLRWADTTKRRLLAPTRQERQRPAVR